MEQPPILWIELLLHFTEYSFTLSPPNLIVNLRPLKEPKLENLPYHSGKKIAL